MTDKCGGTGFFCEMRMGDSCTLGSPCPHQKPLTNEEWLHTLNTEQLAEWLVEVTQYCYECGTDVHNCECCPFGKCIDKGFAMEWLKQPHQ